MKLFIFTGQQHIQWQSWLKSISLSEGTQLQWQPFEAIVNGEHFASIAQDSAQIDKTADDETVWLTACSLEQISPVLDTLSDNIEFHVVAFYAEPQKILSTALSQALTQQRDVELTTLINQWSSDADDLLHLSLSRMGSTSLVNFDTCQHSPNALFTMMAETELLSELASNVNPEVIANNSVSENTAVDCDANAELIDAAHPNLALIQLIVQQAFFNTPLLAIGFEQLESASDLPAAESALAALDIEQSWLALTQHAKQQTKLHSALSERSEQVDTLQQLASVQVQKWEHQLEEQVKRLTQLEEDNQQLSSDKQQLNDENELALLQIQQLQEELESTFTEAQQAKASLDSLTQTQQGLQAQCDQLQQHNQQLSSDKQQLSDENELALLQIQQLQEELESTFIQATDHQNARNQLQQQNQSLEAQVTQFNKELQQAQDTFKQQLTRFDTEKQTLQQENELTLLQINQLQEELEDVHVYSQQQNEKLTELQSAFNQKDRLCVELAQAKQQLESQRGEWTEKSRVLQTELTQTLAKLESVNQERTRLEQAYTKLVEERSALQLKDEQSAQQRQALLQELAELKSQLTWQVLEVNPTSSLINEPVPLSSSIADDSPIAPEPPSAEMADQSVVTAAEKTQQPDNSDQQLFTPVDTLKR